MSADLQPGGSAAPADDRGTVDERNPWLGLVSFTEETRAFFFGRDEEVSELARRVQRKLLTVLFGKSGLGKTSVLRAGLVPRLRAQGYCPVYVRIAYGRDAPEPAEQIKAAIRRAANASGQWTRAGVSAEGESLWEFLHHRDDVLRDEAGATLTPLLIFDQFEELFTLAQSDEFARSRAARFIEELSDLVENRPPKALEARLDEDESAAERFDFERSDYRVLISLREDYLAPLESLKKSMPSLSQNRLRLAPMSGAQALEAVLRPGKGLVSEEVAAAIVRFVAGGSELAHAEVEPSLLSLICRELNDARLGQGRETISLDLLAGSHESILASFYERSLADQPTAVRRIIEDELLTESGFRDNVAEETLLRHLQAAGAAPGTLATLVNRRLLRIEERLDVRRVELTHDVLCGVVKASRDQRHEREARAAAERVLEEQRAREKAARHALRRARAIAIGCILLAALALSAAVYAYRAERQAQQSQALAEQARSHAQRLIGYLDDDFERQLESFGQLKVIAQFTQRQIDYFHALPPELRSAETVRNGALALTEHANTLWYLGEYGAGLEDTTEAIGMLEGLRRGGDRSQATLIVLGRAYMTRCLDLTVQNVAGGLSACQHAVAILRPLADRPGAPLPARQAYVEALTALSWADQFGDNEQMEDSVRVARRAMHIASSLHAQGLRNLQVSADYAQAGAYRVNTLANLGRSAEALRVGAEVLAVADGVLTKRPWYLLTLRAKETTLNAMAAAASGSLDPRQETRFALRDLRTARSLLSRNPNDVYELYNFGLTLTTACDALWARGRLGEALDWCRRSLDAWGKASKRLGESYRVQVSYSTTAWIQWEAISGDPAGAIGTAARAQRLIWPADHRRRPHRFGSLSAALVAQVAAAEALYERGDLPGASRVSGQAIARLRAAKPAGQQHFVRDFLLYDFSNIHAHAEYQLGHFAAAEHAERVALACHKIFSVLEDSDTDNQRDGARVSIWLSLALARQGKFREAAQVASTVVSFEEKLLARDHGDVWVPYDLARALYTQALADPAKHSVLIERAAALLDRLPPRLQRLHDVRLWRQWVRQALRTK